MTYEHSVVETKWLQKWEADGLFQNQAHETNSKSQDAGKMYLLFAFAYPSGAGLHVGHVESKTALDILARYYRMKGKRVFFPVGWDAFGLPAENYAVKTGIAPAITTKNAIKTFERQVRRVGISYDWASEVATNHPGYYKWTQWLFEQLYKKDLAYKGRGMVNWCPSCQTVLANEQVVNGCCERCGASVIQKELEQWYFKITKYQDELITGLDEVDWPAATKQQQLHWIGKKEGARVRFKIQDSRFKNDVEVFTTRLDTIFGVTFLVIAPELAQLWIDRGWKASAEVSAYIAASFHKTEEQRKVGEKIKTGVNTGLKAINPANGDAVPVFVADYVLMDVGTGAVMGVPAHDERDFGFARIMNLPIRQVVAPTMHFAVSVLMSADKITLQELQELGIEILERQKSGTRVLKIPNRSLVAYEALVAAKLDAGFWNEYVGEQIVFLFKHADGRIERIELSDKTHDNITAQAKKFNSQIDSTKSVWDWLADVPEYKPYIIHHNEGQIINSGTYTGMLSKEATLKLMMGLGSQVVKKDTHYHLRDWLISRQRYWGAPIPVVYDPQGKPHLVKEEHLPWLLPTDVDFKPTGESPLKSSKEFVERTERLYGKGWRPEFDTMDTFVDSSWYYLRFTDARNEKVFAAKEQLARWLPIDFYMIGPEHIVLHLLYARFFTKFLRDEGYFSINEPFKMMRHQGMILGPDHKKMSKSKGNVIDPDVIIDQFGADTLRMYEMFMGPIDADKPWSTTSVVGVFRFLNRIYSLVTNTNGDTSPALKSKLHQTLKKVSEDIPTLKFNTAIAAMMELVNEWDTAKAMSKEDKQIVIKMLAPFAPFMAEELYEKLQETSNKKQDDLYSVHQQSWPEYDSLLAEGQNYVIVIQVNSKMRHSLVLPRVEYETWSQPQQTLEEKAGADPKVAKWLENRQVIKVIFVPPSGKRQGLLNWVLR